QEEQEIIINVRVNVNGSIDNKEVCVDFFFQAEDGIRDYKVTGVQTCALPISSNGARSGRGRRRTAPNTNPRACSRRSRRACGSRSEERRVGKECRIRWTAYD